MRIDRLPVSVQSLIIQCAGIAGAMALVWLFREAGIGLSLWEIAFAEGVMAASVSVWLKQAGWWPPMHLLFFPAALAVLFADIPSDLYLGGFLALTLFYGSSCRTQVPLYLSNRKAREALGSLLPVDAEFRFVDIGSGFGGVPFYLEKEFPKGSFIGVELEAGPWLVSRIRSWRKRSRAQFLRMDYERLNLASFDVVFAFLSPVAMPALWDQARAQMKKGALLVSLSFPMEGVPPDLVLPLGDGEGKALYGWRM